MSILSFELTLLELASEARYNRVRSRLGQRNGVRRAAQFIVMFNEEYSRCATILIYPSSAVDQRHLDRYQHIRRGSPYSSRLCPL